MNKKPIQADFKNEADWPFVWQNKRRVQIFILPCEKISWWGLENCLVFAKGLQMSVFTSDRKNKRGKITYHLQRADN
jgi:hypothetical protein